MRLTSKDMVRILIFSTSFLASDFSIVLCSSENTVIFVVANIQTVLAAFTLAFGTRPWKAVEYNFYFLILASAFAIVGFALVLNEAWYIQWMRNVLKTVSLPLSFR